MLMGSHPASEPMKGCHQLSPKAESRSFSGFHFPPPSPTGHVWSSYWDGNADSLPLSLERVQAKGGGRDGD